MSDVSTLLPAYFWHTIQVQVCNAPFRWRKKKKKNKPLCNVNIWLHILLIYHGSTFGGFYLLFCGLNWKILKLTKMAFRLYFMSFLMFFLIFKYSFVDHPLRHSLSCNFGSPCCEWEGEWEQEFRKENENFFSPVISSTFSSSLFPRVLGRERCQTSVQWEKSQTGMGEEKEIRIRNQGVSRDGAWEWGRGSLGIQIQGKSWRKWWGSWRGKSDHLWISI